MKLHELQSTTIVEPYWGWAYGEHVMVPIQAYDIGFDFDQGS